MLVTICPVGPLVSQEGHKLSGTVIGVRFLSNEIPGFSIFVQRNKSMGIMGGKGRDIQPGHLSGILVVVIKGSCAVTQVRVAMDISPV
jgi:hypothetical protein